MCLWSFIFTRRPTGGDFDPLGPWVFADYHWLGALEAGENWTGLKMLGWVPCSVLSVHTASHVLLGRELEAPGKLWPLGLCCPHCTRGQDGPATLNWKIKEVQPGWSRADVFTRWWVSWGAINVTARLAAEGKCTWGQWNYGFLGSHHYFNKRKSDFIVLKQSHRISFSKNKDLDTLTNFWKALGSKPALSS